MFSRKEKFKKLEAMKKQDVNSVEGETTTEKTRTTPATPAKCNNSHMSPPDQDVQTKVKILSPKLKEMFINSMRREILRNTDGYDTEDEIPLSQLRMGSGKDKVKKATSSVTTDLDDSIAISEDLTQNTTAEVTMEENNEVSNPNSAADNEVNNEEVRSEGDAVDHNVNGSTTIDSKNAGESNDLDTSAATQNGNDPDTGNDVNKDQLIGDQRPEGRDQDILGKLLLGMETINKKLEKLDIVKRSEAIK